MGIAGEPSEYVGKRFHMPIYVMIVGADSRAVHTAIRQDDRPRYQ